MGRLRVLFFTSSSANYQEDIVHEGLDELLGADRVVYFPHKEHRLFSRNLYPDLENQACAAPRWEAEDISQRAAEIGAIIVGSVRDSVPPWQRLQHLFPGRPVAWLHGEDGCDHPWPPDVVYTHRFKRELLIDEAGLYPLPFAAPPLAMAPAARPRDIDVSFVARPNHAWRFEVAARLAREGFMVQLDCPMSRRDYCDILNRSKICVSVRGAGYDTMRYWEIPYHGALLLSERLPLLIPDNFVDGESAVFFDSLDDMVRQIGRLLTDPERLERIAAAGQAWAQTKHTALARARYLLETIGFQH